MAVYVILEVQRGVVVVSVTWLELELAEEIRLPVRCLWSKGPDQPLHLFPTRNFALEPDVVGHV